MEFQHHDLFENLVEAFPDPIAIHCDYNLVYINKAGADMLGSTVEALIGKSILEIVHPDSWDDSRIYIDPILREGPSTKTRNISLVGADGKIIEVSLTSTVTSYIGKPAVLVSYRDITEQQRADKAMKESKELVTNILESMTDAVFAVDHNWSVNLRTGKYMISKGIEKLYGYPVSAFSEDPAFWKRLVHPDDLYLAENEDMERFSGKPSVHQYRMIHANGGVRVIRNRITPILDRSENLIKIVGTFVDITEQERMEQRARESQEWLSTTLTCIGDSVIAADITGKITFMNPVAETLTAWKQEEALGKDVREVLQLINEQTRKEVTNPISKVMKEKRSVSLANHTILINKEGAEIPIDDSAAPILNDRGDMTGIVMVFRDVIERRRYEETIKHYAFHDALTGLPNRRLCNDRLTIALTNAKRNNKGLATMFLDLDCFKLINDTWGHELSRVVRSITDKLAEKFIINGQALFTSSSIGTSFYPNDGKMKKRSRNYRLLEN